MLIRNLLKISVLCVITIFLFSCKTEEVILHGDITGTVKDIETSLPIGAAKVKINSTNDSTSTGYDGMYYLNNITPGEYEIQASKSSYYTQEEKIDILSAETHSIDFSLGKIPLPIITPEYLDFSIDTTSLSFTILNIADGNLGYYISASKDWITITPQTGIIGNEAATINVTIDTTELTKDTIYETITLVSYIGKDKLPDITINIYLNGLMYEGKYYRIVKIGTQTWFKENLNVGNCIFWPTLESDNGIIEKYCYNNSEYYCDIYGGLYSWDEMMKYNPSDSGIVGTTQGICPEGWHIPTKHEFEILIEACGGYYVAGGNLKETGTKHWDWPNIGATNVSGFTALAAGMIWPDRAFFYMGCSTYIHSSTEVADKPEDDYILGLWCDNEGCELWGSFKVSRSSVRCIKD